jgi:hypothetical protein
MADIVYVLAGRGEIVTQGTPEEVFRDAARLRRSNVEPPVLAELFQRLEEMGVTLGRPLAVEEAARAIADWGRAERARVASTASPAPATHRPARPAEPAVGRPGLGDAPAVQPTLPLGPKAPGENA